MRTFLFLTIYLASFFNLNAQPKIHSHNDYDQDVPFYKAYSLKAYSIEADVFEKDGNILVAHNKEDLPKASTLEEMYINPILQVYQQNKGKAWRESDKNFCLLIDLKSPTEPLLSLLVAKLEKYSKVFDSAINPHAVRIVITGNMPEPKDFKKYPSFISFDGRINTKYSEEELNRIAFISLAFTDYSSWKGNGEIPANDLTKIIDVIHKTHQMNKIIRFWGTPDNSVIWASLQTIGVDITNTDKLNECYLFLR